MSARPQRVTRPEGAGLRVLRGRKFRKPAIAPWMIMALVGITAFLGLVFARTSLDNSAFELAELNAMIAEQTELNRDLNIEIANLENPARIAPLAEEMGLVIPDVTHQILVDLDRDAPQVVQANQEGQ
ncbi:MAG TPA: hypothetical protein VMO52_03630 [Acidimicrobiia bacterium]|nr:hypothetical protein [Acidimicrobiia bacterium]